MARKDLTALSRTMSHALRHEPWLYELELELDAEGWTPVAVEALLAALRAERKDWKDLAAEDFAEVIRTSSKRRYEMADGRIRALYGHSVPGKLARTASMPPQRLYHGTSPETLEAKARTLGSPGLLVSAPFEGALFKVLPRVGYVEANRIFFKKVTHG